ncbi:MAG TPA: hypothetical protein VNP04_15610 [Alphaproteobacteria bacterium]|nr:hypothetical protein [Alphaproteobacteria bacterium]
MPSLQAERRYYQRHRDQLASRAKWRQRFHREDAQLQALDHHLHFAISQVRWLPPAMRQALRQLGLWADVVQTCRLAAIEAYRQRLGMEETSRLAQRRIYRLLRNAGWRRQKRSQVWVSDLALETATPGEARGASPGVNAGRN